MLIAFVHNQKAFLPALQGYVDFFSRYNIRISVCTAKELSLIEPDIEWHFMGFDFTRKNASIKIHDYSSASVPPLSKLKNKLKVNLNADPDYRLFPNEFICKSFGFQDDIPFGFRDVGILQKDIVTLDDATKKIDFIYVGEMKYRRLEKLIACFTKGVLSKRTILFLTKDYQQLSASLKNHPNIQFNGPVLAAEVKNYIRSARFGINYIPDITPFNQQASTKFLEYAANKIPIVTTRYPWIENFHSKYGGDYFFLEDDLSNFTWEGIHNNTYNSPDLSEWTWDHQIRRSGILEFLSSKFPGMKW